MKTPSQLITDADKRDWAAFCDEWTERMLLAADTALAEYTCGIGSKRSLDEVVAMADHACEQQIPPVRLGHIPAWFKQRLKRVLGPEYFRHLNFTSPWFENAGSAKLPLDVIASSSQYCHQQATEIHDVFVIEPIRPWVISKTDKLPDRMTQRQYEEILPVRRGVFLDVLAKLLDQPMAIAEATRCRLQLERAAHGGWRRMRAMFIPFSVQEPDYFTPVSYHLRTCWCRRCRRARKAS